MSKHNMDIKLWRNLLKMLRQNFPTIRPVVVKRVNKKDSESTTFFDSHQYNIYISTNQSVSAQIDSLLHEYAHAKAIDEACQHHGRFGSLYGEIYQAWEKWDNS